MKKKIQTIIYFLLSCIVLSSCSSGADNNNFIPGMYVREVHNEFSIGRDTLVINPSNTTMYSIIHTGSYQRIKDGKLLSAKSIHENWTATYDNDKKILQETKRGRVLSFDVPKNILLLGSSHYKKIK